MKQNFYPFFNCQSKEDWQNFKTALWQNYPTECQQLIARSQRFVKGDYLFDNDWDMEKTVVPVHFAIDDLPWGVSPNQDLEWNYMLNRQRFLVDVAIAYVLTDDTCYPTYLEQFLTRFIQDNPLNAETVKYSWRTIDVGLRLINWFKLFEIHQYYPLFSEKLWQRLTAEVEVQADYLLKHLTLEHGQSNWQILELAGLFGASVTFPEFSDANKWQEVSWDYLDKSLALQVEADGMQREQSFMYHNEVLLCLLEIMQLAKRNQISIPDTIIDYTQRLTDAASIFVKPNGMQAVYGDSDVEDMTGILQYAEVLLDGSKGTLQPDFFTVLSLGYGDFKVNNKYLLSESVHHFEQAGVMIAKSPQEYHLFKCGPLGGGHGHDDWLHLELSYQNQDILVDSGRYSYEVAKDRLVYKAPRAHNTFIVDLQNFNQHNEAWDAVKVATPINQKMTSREGIHFFEGGHLGYFDLPDPVYVDRKVLHFPEGFSLVSDLYLAKKAHEIQTFYHWHTQDLQSTETSFISETLKYQIHCLDKEADKKVKKVKWSPRYNDLEEIDCAVITRKIKGSAVSSYVLSPSSIIEKCERIPIYSENHLMSPEIVEAIKLTLHDGSQRLVIIQHQEPNHGRRGYVVEGNFYYGRVLVIQDEKVITLY